MNKPQESLPTYGNPPLVETVLSVQFEPLSAMTDAHLGAFWFERKKDAWPVVQTQPPIDPNIEIFDEADQWLPQGLELRLSRKPEIRVQMINQPEGRMIQLQRDRLAYNWRRHGGEAYPRFPALYKEFDLAWRDLLAFVADQNLGQVKPRQWEVIYVNHIAKGELWQGIGDWSGILSGLLEPVPRLPEGAELRGCHGQWIFELTPRKGRLYVEATPGRTTDKPSQNVLVLRFTARGPIGGPNDLNEGLNLGHRAIVQSFDRLVSPKARSHWQRHDSPDRS